jgi:hypothetical protein
MEAEQHVGGTETEMSVENGEQTKGRAEACKRYAENHLAEFDAFMGEMITPEVRASIKASEDAARKKNATGYLSYRQKCADVEEFVQDPKNGEGGSEEIQQVRKHNRFVSLLSDERDRAATKEYERPTEFRGRESHAQSWGDGAPAKEIKCRGTFEWRADGTLILRNGDGSIALPSQFHQPNPVTDDRIRPTCTKNSDQEGHVFMRANLGRGDLWCCVSCGCQTLEPGRCRVMTQEEFTNRYEARVNCDTELSGHKFRVQGTTLPECDKCHKGVSFVANRGDYNTCEATGPEPPFGRTLLFHAHIVGCDAYNGPVPHVTCKKRLPGQQQDDKWFTVRLDDGSLYALRAETEPKWPARYRLHHWSNHVGIYGLEDDEPKVTESTKPAPIATLPKYCESRHDSTGHRFVDVVDEHEFEWSVGGKARHRDHYIICVSCGLEVADIGTRGRRLQPDESYRATCHSATDASGHRFGLASDASSVDHWGLRMQPPLRCDACRRQLSSWTIVQREAKGREFIDGAWRNLSEWTDVAPPDPFRSCADDHPDEVYQADDLSFLNDDPPVVITDHSYSRREYCCCSDEACDCTCSKCKTGCNHK